MLQPIGQPQTVPDIILRAIDELNCETPEPHGKRPGAFVSGEFVALLMFRPCRKKEKKTHIIEGKRRFRPNGGIFLWGFSA